METDLPKFFKMTFTVIKSKFEKVKRIITPYTDSKAVRTLEYYLQTFLSIYLSVLHKFDPPKKKDLCKKKVFKKPISETKIWYQLNCL